MQIQRRNINEGYSKERGVGRTGGNINIHHKYQQISAHFMKCPKRCRRKLNLWPALAGFACLLYTARLAVPPYSPLPSRLSRRPVSIPCPLAGEVIVFYIIALLSISTRKNQQRATTNCRRGVPDPLRHYPPSLPHSLSSLSP